MRSTMPELPSVPAGAGLAVSPLAMPEMGAGETAANAAQGFAGLLKASAAQLAAPSQHTAHGDSKPEGAVEPVLKPAPPSPVIPGEILPPAGEILPPGLPPLASAVRAVRGAMDTPAIEADVTQPPPTNAPAPELLAAKMQNAQDDAATDDAPQPVPPAAPWVAAVAPAPAIAAAMPQPIGPASAPPPATESVIGHDRNSGGEPAAAIMVLSAAGPAALEEFTSSSGIGRKPARPAADALLHAGPSASLPAPALAPTPSAAAPVLALAPSPAVAVEAGAALAGNAIGPAAPDIDAAIEQVSGLRDAMRSARPELVLRHAEFGAVSMRIEAGAPGEWRAMLNNRDPGFIPAVQAALAERAVAAASDTAAGGSANGGQSNAQSSAQGSGGHATSGQGSGSGMAFGQGHYGSSPGSGQGSSQPYLAHNQTHRQTAGPGASETSPGDQAAAASSHGLFA